MPDGETVATHIEQMAGDDLAAGSNLDLDIPCSAVARLTAGAGGLSQWNKILSTN